MKPTASPHTVSRLMRGAIPPLPPYAYVCCLLSRSEAWDSRPSGILRCVTSRKREDLILHRGGGLKSHKDSFTGPDVEICHIHHKSFPLHNLRSPANRRSLNCGDEKASSNKLSSINEFLVFSYEVSLKFLLGQSAWHNDHLHFKKGLRVGRKQKQRLSETVVEITPCICVL